MQFGIENPIMKNGTTETVEGIELLKLEIVWSLNVNDGYKYLGTVKRDSIK